MDFLMIIPLFASSSQADFPLQHHLSSPTAADEAIHLRRGPPQV